MPTMKTFVVPLVVGTAMLVGSPARSETLAASPEAKEPVTNRIGYNRIGYNRIGYNSSNASSSSTLGVPADGAVAQVSAVVLPDGTRLTR
jgi:hypothetical protein